MKSYHLFTILRDLALLFLAPLLAITVWFLLLQAGIQDEQNNGTGQTGVFVLAVVSFTVGLVTNQVVLTLTSFTSRLLNGISKGDDNKDEDHDDDQEKKKLKLDLQLDKTAVNVGGTVTITAKVQSIDSKSPISGVKLRGNVLAPSKKEYAILEPKYTDKEGKTVHQLKIEENSEFGLYAIALETLMDGYEKTESSITFDVRKLVI